MNTGVDVMDKTGAGLWLHDLALGLVVDADARNVD